MNVINHGDCVSGMKSLIESGDMFDLIIADPPFNLSVENNFQSLGNRQGIDFGSWDYDFDQFEWFDTALKLLKPGGSFLIFNTFENLAKLKEFAEDKGFTHKALLRWVKSNPMPRNRDRLYVSSIETFIWVTNGRGWTFNRQDEAYEDGSYNFPVVHHSRRIHPTQKPIELVEKILKIHSNTGDRVLLPFGGSGVESVACGNLGRDSVSFELNYSFYTNINKVTDLNKRMSSIEAYKRVKEDIKYIQVLPYTPDIVGVDITENDLLFNKSGIHDSMDEGYLIKVNNRKKFDKVESILKSTNWDSINLNPVTIHMEILRQL